jgi:hypothetical protein
MHLASTISGSPAAFISMPSTGQLLWQRAPQAMHRPSRSLTLPRGFLIFVVASLMLLVPSFSSNKAYKNSGTCGSLSPSPTQPFFRESLRYKSPRQGRGRQAKSYS